jgi:antibiotic biosynthesis monooxygenase (ABM) superfamily enzyme
MRGAGVSCWHMVHQDLDNPSRARRWLAPVATTLGAWLIAFVVVTALLTVFGDVLKSLPLTLRALVISGVLAALMVNVVMPVFSTTVAHWLGRPRRTRLPEAAAHD